MDGINVTKSLVRQTLKYESLTGEYLGTSVYGQTCTNPANNGTLASVAEITIAHTGASFQMTTVDISNDSCTLVGTYVQDGQVGRVTGPMTCTSGLTGTFTYFEIQSSISGVMGRFTSSLSMGGATCNAQGRLAAVKGF